MIIVSSISFLLTLFVVLEILVRKSDFFSPVRIFLLAQSLSLGVSFLALDESMTPFKPLTSLVYFGGCACFVIGAVVARLLSRPPETAPAPAVDWEAYNWRLHLWLAFFLFGFAAFGMWGAHSIAGGFPLLAHEKIKVLKKFQESPYYFMFPFAFSGMVMALFFMYLVRPSSPIFWRNVGFWMVFFTFSLFSMALSRIALMFFIFFAMVFYHNAVRRLSLLKLFFIFGMCFVLVLVTGYFKVKDLEEKTSIKASEITKIAFKVPYVYLANNFWNLDFALNPPIDLQQHPTTYGFTVLEGVAEVPGFNLGEKLRQDTRIDNQFNERAAKRKGLNTVTYHWTLYKDFGLSGVFLGSFLIGLLIGSLYHRMRARPTLLNLSTYSFLSFFVADSVFTFMTESPIYTYGFLFVCACCYGCQVILPRRPSFLRAT